MNPTLATESLAQYAGKYLTIGIAKDIYAIAAASVREIIRFQKITPMPQMPDRVKGVINLRGRVVPVVDLRTTFGFAADITDRTCIVVTQLETPDGRSVPMGLVVDTVEEVEHFPTEALAPPPTFGAAATSGCLLGLAKTKDGVKLLLDLERTLQEAL